MNLSFHKLKEVFPSLNDRPITIEDFYLMTSQECVPILELRLKKRGYHLFNVKQKQDFIILNKGMKDLQYWETLAHEYFHIHGFTEFEANAFRLIAIIPLPLLKDRWVWLEENPTRYARRLWNEREKLAFLYGM